VRIVAASAVLVLAASAPAYAQATEPPVRRLEVSIGGGWSGGAGLGSSDANLRANMSPAEPLRLFSTDTRMRGTATLQAEAGFAFNRRWGVEGGMVMSRPELQTSISEDAEGAPPITVGEGIDQYQFEGRLIVLLNEIRLGPRTIPFAVAGAGYLRQLHEGRTLVEEGHVYHAGGGLKHWFLARESGLVRAAGVRIDARLYLRVAGIAFEDGPKPHGAVSGSAFVTF
jgi:hypothetical protein